MKKAVLILIAILAFSALGFASPNVSFGIWGRTILDLAKGTTNPADTTIKQSWGPDWAWGPTERIDLTFVSDAADYSFRFNFSNGTAPSIDNMFGTLKLIPDLLTVRIGKYTGDGYDAFRKAGHNDNNNSNTGRMGGTGMWISVTPKDTNFDSVVYYKMAKEVGGNAFGGFDSILADNIQATAFAASYTVPKTVKIAAGSTTSGWVDTAASTNTLQRNIFGRVELLMVDGLTCFLDVRYVGIEASTAARVDNMLELGYGLDALRLDLTTNVGIALTGSNTINWSANPTVGYNLGDINLGLNMGISGDTTPASSINWSVEPSVRLNKFNAQISLNVSGSTASGSFINWKVPVMVDFSMW